MEFESLSATLSNASEPTPIDFLTLKSSFAPGPSKTEGLEPLTSAGTRASARML